MKKYLLGSSALAGASSLTLVVALGLAQDSRADDECGPANAGDTVTCTPAGNNFPGGIQYQVVDLTIVVEDGVIIDTTGAAGEPGGIVSGDFSFGNLVVKAGTSGGTGVTITTDGSGAEGIDVRTVGTATITSFTDISTSGTGAEGISSYGEGGVAISSTGTITTKGTGADGIHAYSTAASVSVTSTGKIATSGDSSYGIGTVGYLGATANSTGDIATGGVFSTAIGAFSSKGAVSISSTGDLATDGEGSVGISAYAKGAGADVIVTSSGNITTKGDSADGIDTLALGKYGDVAVASSGHIATTGNDATGIEAAAFGSYSKVTVSSAGNITTSGGNSDGIHAHAGGYISGVVVTSTGNITTSGGYSEGIYATGIDEGTGVVVTTVGNITTSGKSSEAIYATATSTDADVTITSSGTITTKGDSAEGIDALALGKYGDVAVASSGDITTTGNDATGIEAAAFGSYSKVTVSSAGNITTSGGNSDGIHAHAGGYVSGVVVTSNGNITTSGGYSEGIYATGIDEGTGVVVTTVGNITTSGKSSEAIYTTTTSTDADVTITSTGNISTKGDGSTGIFATAGASDVSVSQEGYVSATGLNSDGIFASATGGAVAVIAQGHVLGGSGSGRGIFIGALDASTLTIGSGGSVGALSDAAILGGAEDLVIVNDGTITGFIALGAGADVLNNTSPTSFNLRAFADTDGDGVRDTESVAIADFGAGADAFDNTGTLRLSNVSGATAWDTTGQITHPGGGNADITQDGVEQGFLTNLETFVHSGLITLADGAAGDLLVITDQADGSTAGNNLFTSNGGALALDVVLDDGSSGQSDVLILDKSALGTGPTRLLVTGVDSSGGNTGTGDGILVVNVRTASDGTEFALANNPVAGAYQYELFFQNQAATDQDWYLRSSFFEGALEYPAIATGALLTWYSDLGSLHERLGEVRRATEAGQTATFPLVTTASGDTSAVRKSDGGQAGWLRVMGADMDIEQDGPADFDLDTVRAEAGFDVGFDNVLSEDWLVLGAFAGYGWSQASFESGSEIDFDIATVGTYATYFRGPYYLDALVKFDWLDGNYNSDAVSEDGDVEIPVIGLSLETGYRFDLTDGGFYLQPQARLSYAHAGGDRFIDDSGAEIKLEDADSLRGRLGARLGQELGTIAGAAAEPVKGNFYFEASVNQEFLGETEARVSGLTLDQELPDTTFQVGAGFDIALPKNGVTFTVDADYTFGDDVEGIGATGGIRINW